MPLDNLFADNLKDTNWLGRVVDNQDPDLEGKVKVRVFGKFDDISDEDLPWARPCNRITGGSATGSGFHSVPKVDSVVGIQFDNGDIYAPEFFYIQEISDELKAEIESSYDNAHSLIYDTVTEGGVRVFFTEERGLMLDYKETQINIKNDNSITIRTASGRSVIEIKDDGTLTITQSDNITITTDANINVECSNLIVDNATSIELGSGAIERVILGDSFMNLFNTHTHVGNLGAPTSPPMSPMVPTQHLSQKEVKVR
jgi:hypothetical protein